VWQAHSASEEKKNVEEWRGRRESESEDDEMRNEKKNAMSLNL
jgi:hypothetical protein